MARNKIIQCSKCVLDTNGNSEIFFDNNGVCNYCHEYIEKAKSRLISPEKRKSELKKIVSEIKSNPGKSDYDCIIGVSGGVDSTFTAHLVKKLGLNPLAVHFDNGWNSELAVHNIEKTLKNLNIDLYTYVVNWEEFRDLQLSFLKSSTPDGEIPTDHAILSTLYKIASAYNVKYIVSGNNFKNEGVMPLKWAYGHIDWKYIKNIQKRFGEKKLKTYPYFNLKKFLWYTIIKKIKMVSILNYIDYDKDDAMQILENDLGWEYYGGKHYESNYTKFFQGVILPEKFKIEKRKLHLSAQILSNQISKNDAILLLKEPIYPKDSLAHDKEYIIKKLEIDEAKYDKIMKDDIKFFKDYPNNYFIHKYLRMILNYLRSKKVLPN